MAKRVGLGISAKMITTTTLLVVVTVVGFGFLNHTNVKRVIDQAAQRQVQTFRAGRELQGEVGTPLFARAVEQLLIDRGRDADIFALVERTVAGDSKPQDQGLSLALVLDPNQAVVVSCHEGKVCEQGNHEALAGRYGELATRAWAGALDEWKQGGGEETSMLVRFDVSDGSRSYRAFAVPVFVGEAPTRESTLTPEPPPARQGYLVLAYDLAPIRGFTEEASRQEASESRDAAIRTGVVGVMCVLIGSLLAVFQGLSISKPIKLLSWQADQIARGDLGARVQVTSTNELGVLGDNFNFMADQIRVLLEEAAGKARIEQELELARAIQDTLVPSHEPVALPGLSLAGYFQPAAQTGGDWWTWHDLGEGRVLVVIGDVTGHGVSAAMITAVAKAACDVARRIENPGVERLLEIMNYAIFESAKRTMQMTVFASIIDTRLGTITYANAGHSVPYILRADGKGEVGTLMSRGNRLGDVADSAYDVKTAPIGRGDVLAWYTDGLVDCEAPTGEAWGEKRFRAVLRHSAHLDAATMRDAVIADASQFFAETPRKDDVTLVIGRLT